MSEARKLVRKLNRAEEYKVRDWPKYHHAITQEPGAYRFTDADGFRVYVGESRTNLRARLRFQIRPATFGHRWTLSDPPPKGICRGRNLLNNVLKDQNDGRPFTKPHSVIDPDDQTTIDALNRAFRYMSELVVQWVRCPDGDMAKRVEHLASRCALDDRCAHRPLGTGSMAQAAERR